MIDFINTKTILTEDQILPPVWNASLEPFQWNGMDFFAKNEFSYSATKESVKRIGLDNLHCSFQNGQTATFNLSNSLHKLCHGGINYTDFKRSEIIDTCNYISEILKFSFPESKLFGRFEYAVNIEVEDPKAVYMPQIGYSNYKPIQMLNKNKQYGTRFILGSYEIKTYAPADIIKSDRMTTSNINKKYIRFEIVGKTWYLRNKGIKLSQPKDLFEKDTLSKLGDSLFNISKKIQLMPFLKDEINYKDLDIFYYFKNATSEQKKFFRKEKERTYYRRQKRYKELLKEYKNETIDISEKVRLKWIELMES